MNVKEAIKAIINMGEYEHFVDEPISKKSVLSIINQIDEPQKVTVPKVAIDYYEKYKNQISGFDEWFGDFYDSGFLEEFPDGEKLAEWLYDNTNEINNQRELALANLIVNGPSAVEVEPEKLYTVEIPSPNTDIVTCLARDAETGKIVIDSLWEMDEVKNGWKLDNVYQLTEAEIKQDFEWAWKWAEEVKEGKNEL